MTRFPTILREPLVQFLLIALALFAIDRLVNTDQDGADPATRIELTVNDLRQMTLMWLAQGRPMPGEQQLRAMMEQRVGLEILSREAVALGLDENDEIVKRRLAQKMEFLFEDLGQLQDPSPAELGAWLKNNPERSRRRAAQRPGPARVRASSDSRSQSPTALADNASTFPGSMQRSPMCSFASRHWTALIRHAWSTPRSHGSTSLRSRA